MKNIERLKVVVLWFLLVTLEVLLCYGAQATDGQQGLREVTSLGYTSAVHDDDADTIQKRAAQGDSTTHSASSLTTEYTETVINETDPPHYTAWCPSQLECYKLGGDCIDCSYDENCYYGKNVSVTCRPKPEVNCTGDQSFTRWLHCRYCYQTPHWDHHCTNSTQCRVVSAYRDRYQANCTVKPDTLCLGQRRFHKMQTCNWTSGKRWSTAIILSVTLGGFGADRFYLGLWEEGIGKLFSFGGLGVWTLVDVILVATGYIGPADGSLYIF